MLRPHVPQLVDEVTATIREALPGTDAGGTEAFLRNIRWALEESSREFLDEIESGASSAGRGLHVQLGRYQMRAGRTLEETLAVYRLGARVAWQRIALTMSDAGVDVETLALLAESMFAYIDELSARSATGYAEAHAAAAAAAHERRQQLVRLLVSEPAAPRSRVQAAAQEIPWPLPRSLAALAMAEAQPPATGRWPTDALVGRVGEHVCVLMPDPDAPGRREELRRIIGEGKTAGMGPTVAWREAAHSFRRAVAVLGLAREGALPAAPIVVADDHLPALVLHNDSELAAELADKLLSPLSALSPSVRAKLTETMSAWLDQPGHYQQVAARLGVHPQTVRYRVSQLRELLGDALDRSDSRFELQLALRVHPTRTAGPASTP